MLLPRLEREPRSRTSARSRRSWSTSNVLVSGTKKSRLQLRSRSSQCVTRSSMLTPGNRLANFAAAGPTTVSAGRIPAPSVTRPEGRPRQVSAIELVGHPGQIACTLGGQLADVRGGHASARALCASPNREPPSPRPGDGPRAEDGIGYIRHGAAQPSLVGTPSGLGNRHSWYTRSRWLPLTKTARPLPRTNSRRWFRQTTSRCTTPSWVASHPVRFSPGGSGSSASSPEEAWAKSTRPRTSSSTSGSPSRPSCRNCADPLAVERFKREVHLARKVTHPSCAASSTSSTSGAAGRPVLLPDDGVVARVRRWPASSPSVGRLSPDQALPLVEQCRRRSTARTRRA